VGVSGVMQQAAVSTFKQMENLNQTIAKQLTKSMQQTSQAIQQAGNHGVEPGKGQHVDVRA
jgi:hypothetical protein